MAESKHMKEKEKKNSKKFVIFLIIIILIVCIYMFIGEFLKIREQNTIKEENLTNIADISNLTTVENEILVLKNIENDGTIRKIIYKYKENILEEFYIIETYIDDEKYDFNKEDYKTRKDIQIMNINDEKKEIQVRKVDFGSDKELTYQEIKNKYMSIVGVYEII